MNAFNKKIGIILQAISQSKSFSKQSLQIMPLGYDPVLIVVKLSYNYLSEHLLLLDNMSFCVLYTCIGVLCEFYLLET